MKASKFIEAQIAFVLKQAEEVTLSPRSAGRQAFRIRRSTACRQLSPECGT
mgnify:CR=1 FL=1